MSRTIHTALANGLKNCGLEGPYTLSYRSGGGVMPHSVQFIHRGRDRADISARFEGAKQILLAHGFKETAGSPSQGYSEDYGNYTFHSFYHPDGRLAEVNLSAGEGLQVAHHNPEPRTVREETKLDIKKTIIEAVRFEALRHQRVISESIRDYQIRRKLNQSQTEVHKYMNEIVKPKAAPSLPSYYPKNEKITPTTSDARNSTATQWGMRIPKEELPQYIDDAKAHFESQGWKHYKTATKKFYTDPVREHILMRPDGEDTHEMLRIEHWTDEHRTHGLMRIYHSHSIPSENHPLLKEEVVNEGEVVPFAKPAGKVTGHIRFNQLNGLDDVKHPAAKQKLSQAFEGSHRNYVHEIHEDGKPIGYFGQSYHLDAAGKEYDNFLAVDHTGKNLGAERVDLT